MERAYRSRRPRLVLVQRKALKASPLFPVAGGLTRTTAPPGRLIFRLVPCRLEPRGWTASPFVPGAHQPLQRHNRLVQLIAFPAELDEYGVPIHAGSVANPDAA